MTEKSVTLLCRRCNIRKLYSDISVNYGPTADGYTSAGGLCKMCAEQLTAARESFAATIGRVLDESDDGLQKV